VQCRIGLPRPRLVGDLARRDERRRPAQRGPQERLWSLLGRRELAHWGQIVAGEDVVLEREAELAAYWSGSITNQITGREGMNAWRLDAG